MRIWKNKKGIAMETAIWFILVIGVLCLMLTNLAMLGSYRTQIEKRDLEIRLELEQIGEDYLADLEENGASTWGEEGDVGEYEYSLVQPEEAGNGIGIFKVWKRTTHNKRTLVLYVKAQVTTETVENTEETKISVDILSWRYSVPDEE